MDTLIIHNVDLDLLEKQRKILSRVIDKLHERNLFDNDDDRVYIEGLHNMLDYWSDKIYHESQNELKLDR